MWEQLLVSFGRRGTIADAPVNASLAPQMPHDSEFMCRTASRKCGRGWRRVVVGLVACAVAGGPVQFATAGDLDQAIQAAEGHEKQWEQTNNPDDLANAAKARSEAGQYGQAIDLYRHLLLVHKELHPALSRQARNGMLDARSHTIPVLLRVEPIDAPENAVLTLRNSSRPYRPWTVKTPLRVLREQTQGPRTYRLELEPGSWGVSLSAPGFREGWSEVFVSQAQAPAEVTVNMVPDMGTVELIFLPATADVQLEVLQGPGLSETSVQRVTNGRVRQHLRVGQWVFEAKAPGFHPLRQKLNVSADRVLQVNFELTPIEQPEIETETEEAPAVLEPRQRYIFAGTLGGVGLLTIAVGIGFLVDGFNRQNSAKWLNEQAASQAGIYDFENFFPATDDDFKKVDLIETIYPRQEYISDKGRGLSLEAVGSALIGGTIGLSVAAVTGLKAPVGKKGQRIWLTEVGIGAALAVAGSAWFGVVATRYNRDIANADRFEMYQTWRPEESVLRSLRINQAVSSVILGVGVGTLIGAGTGALVWRRAEKKSKTKVGAYVQPHAAGLTLHGRF